MVPALVLTAGLATRLRPLSLVRAKAALPVAGEPLVQRILRWLRANGVSDVVLNLHHRPDTLTRVIGDGADLGMRVRYSWEVPVLGSAGGPKRALPLLFAHPLHPSESTFVIVNGDTLTNANLASALHDHQASGALVTMMVVPNTEPDKYGGVLVDDDGSVRGFCRRGSHQPSYHFFGVQVVEAEIFGRVPDGVPSETVAALYPALIAERPGSVRALRCDAEYLDIGTPADYLDTCLRVAATEHREGIIGSGVEVAPTARVIDSILWDDVVIEAGAMIRECVVTDGARVPAGTSWRGVTIRRVDGELAPGERRIGDLAIASL